MPKIVDREVRREEIISVVLKLIATEGVVAVTTRRIAEATGYSNGVLRYYFPGKDAVISAAFQGIFDATNDRVAATEPDPRGLAGLRQLALEIMPLDEQRMMEARIAIHFWQQALDSPDKAALHADVVRQWRSEMIARLDEAREDGDLGADVDVSEAVDELLSMLMGLQVLAVLAPAETSPQREIVQYDKFIARLRR
jgi:AcrR family transcriptional regulator